MENRAHALATGLFILLLGAALVAVVAWFQGDRSEKVGYTVVARSGVPGLNLRAAVKLQGVEIGKVEAIGFDPEEPRQILVRIEVSKQAPLTAGTYARLGYQGITGLSFIDLVAPEDGRPGAPTPPGTRIPLQPSLLDQLSNQGPRLMLALNEATLRLNRLLGDANQQQFAQTLAALGDAASGVARLSQQLQPAAAGLAPLAHRADGVLLSADRSLQRLDELLAQSGALAQELRQRSQALDQLGQAAAQLQGSTQRLEHALVGPGGRPRSQAPLLDELGQASRSLDRLAGDLAEQPQSLIFGRTAPPPGPGEAGFDTRGH